MDRGILPADFDLVGPMVQDICYRNAADYFGFGNSLPVTAITPARGHFWKNPRARFPTKFGFEGNLFDSRGSTYNPRHVLS